MQFALSLKTSLFKTSNTIKSIKKVYVPGYLYNTITSGDVNFLGADQTPNGKAKFDVVFNDSVEHNNLFYKGSSKINERVFNAVSNFNFNNVTMFNPNNIGQCYCLDCDLNQNDINENSLEKKSFSYDTIVYTDNSSPTPNYQI